MKVKFSLFVVILLIEGCSNFKRQQTDWGKVLVVSANKGPEDSNRWIQKNDDIMFTGTLIEGDCERFKKIVTLKSSQTLVVNSQGGLVSEGLCIADEMQKSIFLKTIVDGVCFSSCANYLFLASKEREIKSGIVGFHGNLSALTQEKPQLLGPKGTNVENLKSVLGQEQKFFEALDIPQTFFDLTQKADKGNNDNGRYLFLIPSRESFAKYRIHNVSGEQDLDLVKQLNKRGFRVLYK